MAVIREHKHKKDLVLRLKRIEGQLRGIQAMIEGSSDCDQVAQQIAAARKALDKTFFHVLACAIQASPETGATGKAAAVERVTHAAALLTRFG